MLRKIIMTAMSLTLTSSSIAIVGSKCRAAYSFAPINHADLFFQNSETRLRIEHFNEILQIYVAPERKEGSTTFVFELKDMKFYSSRKQYGCIFVNGRIVQIREYNTDDSYVRGEVKIMPEEKEVIAYSGVIAHSERLDPHDHSALWQAFIKSERPAFKASLEDLPKWRVSNPIREKKKNG